MDHAEDLLLGAGSSDPEVAQDSGGHALSWLEERQQQVLGADETVSEKTGLLLRARAEHGACPLSKSFEGRRAKGETLVRSLLAHP